ncbi:MAG: DUF2934 domain-containing protein [Betaproteobacteria bacterium]|nr:MAG: DUF2934 domain-containing protein [Betaproteobacteria bacterium]
MHSETPKQSRSSKRRSTAQTSLAASARAAKPGATRRFARPEPAAAEARSADIRDSPFAESMRTEADADLRHRLISEAAYALFAERGYRDGYDVDDWLEAEARVDSTLRAGLPRQEEPEEA